MCFGTHLPAHIATAVLAATVHVAVFWNPWSTGNTLLALEVPLLLILVLSGTLARLPVLLYSLTALVVIAMRAFSLGEAVCMRFLHRRVELIHDIQLIDDLSNLLTDSGGRIWLILGPLGLSAIGLSAIILAHRCCSGPARRALAIVSLTHAGLAVTGAPQPWFPVTQRLGIELKTALEPSAYHRQITDEISTALDEAATTPNDLQGVAGKDVHLIFVESYGETLFKHPQLNTFRDETLPRFAEVLSNAGIHARTRLFRSPALGGRSWLAHAALQTGVMVSDQARFDAVVTSPVRPLASYFNLAGYHTVRVAPGLRSPWKHESYFEYSITYTAPDLAYRGPPFAWATMPDQYVFYRVLKNLEMVAGPHFAMWVLVSTHAPFTAHAAFVEEKSLGHGEVFYSLPPRSFDYVWPYLDNAHPGYQWSMAYEFQVLGQVVPKLLANGGLVVLLGDHQPNGALLEDGASWNVPCHVLSTDPALVDAFAAQGFTPDLVPQTQKNTSPLNRLYFDLLSTLSRN